MAQKIKIAGPYILILVLVALLIGFNFIMAYTQNVSTSVTVGGQEPTIKAV